MKVSASKENTLKKIRQALSQSTPIPFPNSEGNQSVYQPAKQELEIEFAEKFTGLLGKFIFCLNEQEMAGKFEQLVNKREWKNIYCREDKLAKMLSGNGLPELSRVDLENCDAGITGCELLIARTGSIVMSAAQQSGRTVSVYSPIHLCIAYMDQLVYDIREGLQLLKEKYKNNLPSLITFATGPSRTADIEKTLVVGVHGPKEVYVFLIDQ